MLSVSLCKDWQLRLRTPGSLLTILMRVNYGSQLWSSRIDWLEVWITSVPALCFSSSSNLLYLVRPSPPPPSSLPLYFSFSVHLSFSFSTPSTFLALVFSILIPVVFLYSSFITIQSFPFLYFLAFFFFPFQTFSSFCFFLFFLTCFMLFLFLEWSFHLHLTCPFPFLWPFLAFFSSLSAGQQGCFTYGRSL